MAKWSGLRVRSRKNAKSHAELKRTSSIGYGTYQPSPPRGDGNVTFFGVEKPAARPRKRRARK